MKGQIRVDMIVETTMWVAIWLADSEKRWLGRLEQFRGALGEASLRGFWLESRDGVVLILKRKPRFTVATRIEVVLVNHFSR